MNSFQLNLTKELIGVVSPDPLGDIIIKITKGPEEVTVEIRLVNKEVSFWIYEDGASILGPEIDDRFEFQDYRDLSNLTRAFLERAASVISGL